MSQRTEQGAEGRLANVACALWLGSDEAAPASVRTSEALITCLGRLFEDVLLVGAASGGHARARVVASEAAPLPALCAALEAASAERVLWLACGSESARAEILLALTAWPVHEVVLPPGADPNAPDCALLLRDPVLKCARDQLAAGLSDLGSLLSALDVAVLDVADLVPEPVTK